MPSFRISGSRPFARASSFLFIVFFVFLCGTVGIHGQTNDKTPATAQDEGSFRLKATSTLVVLRVVVRDAQGRPVENLKKEDFKLFDRGQEQTITQFAVETSVSPSSASIPAPTPGQAAPQTAPAPAAPARFLAFYFDDLNSSDADMIQARDAADYYLAANLQPADHVAIFTSDQILSNFTSDPKQIHEALFKLHVNARALTRAHYCPNMSDYQALQIIEHNVDALNVANDEVRHCDGGALVAPAGMSVSGSGGGGSSSGGSPASAGGYAGSGDNPSSQGSSGGMAAMVIRQLAQNIVNQSQIQARTNLQQIELVVKYLAQMPGQRAVILVSPSFLSQSEQYQLDRLIDHALRSQVVISSLDPKGLAVLSREADASESYIPIDPQTLEAAHRVDSLRELVATAVLANVAEGTGGEYFHNSNDLKAGFGALAGSPTYYTLAFAPKDVQQDGKFHALKVTLTEKEKGFTIQARRGYYAPKPGEAVPKTVAEIPVPPKAAEPKKEVAPLDPEEQAQEQIRQAVLSKTDVEQLPVALDVKLPAGQGDTRELSLSAHLDAAPLHFHKDGDHNLNTVTFVFAVFDDKDNLLNAQQRRAKVNVLDGQLPGFLKAGVDVNLTFELNPGAYRLREVVTDSEDHHMTTLSRDVTIP
jgi:VWFA-related protein